MKMKSEHNDANSAALMKFMHDVGKKVDAWMELEENAAYRREDLKYMFFAYLDTSRPPFGEDANGNIDIAADLKFNDGVSVAPFFAQSHLHTGVSFDDVAIFWTKTRSRCTISVRLIDYPNFPEADTKFFWLQDLRIQPCRITKTAKSWLTIMRRTVYR